MITTLLWTMIAFISPLDQIVEILFSAVGITSFVYYKFYLSFQSFFKNRGIFFYALIIFSIFSASFYPFILDHFGYYVPTIDWLKNFGIVKGLSNIDVVVSQLSFWHIYQTGFSHFIDPFFRINTFMLCVFILYGFESRRWILLTLTPILFLFTQSPSPDLPVLAISLIILNEILSHSKHYKFIFAISIFVFCIKPTLLWLPLFCGLYYLFLKKRSIFFTIPGIVIFLLFISKNIYAFGYPVFPMSYLDVNLSWKPHPELMKISSDFGLLKTFDNQYTSQEIRHFSTFDYLYNWVTLKGIKGVFNIALLLSLIVFGIICWVKKKKILSLLFFAILLKSIVVIVISGQYRFFIDVFFVLTFILFYKSWYAFGKISSLGLTVIILSFLSFPLLIQKLIPSFRPGNIMTGFNIEQLLKPSNFELHRYKNYQIGNIKFNVVVDYPYTFDTPTPAITPSYLKRYENLGIFPQLIKCNDIKSGFIWRKLSENDRKKLNDIITELKIN